MGQTTARTKKDGKHFEILVEEEAALKFKRGEGDINDCLITEDIFYDLKKGEKASDSDLERYFETNDPTLVAEKIIKQGEVVRSSASLNEEQDKKYKKVVDFLTKNATAPGSRPYTPDRIKSALKEAHINVKNKPIESQIPEIIEQLSKIIPIKIETKKVELKVPSTHTIKAYPTLKEYMIKEEWQPNGDLSCVVEVPSGLLMDFYDKINNQTHGSVLSEEIKE